MIDDCTSFDVGMALADLYGYSPYEFIGLDVEDISDSIDPEELAEVIDYLGVE